MVGERLQQLRQELGVTQRELAQLLGFHESTLTNWRNRKDKDPDVRSVIAVADALHLSVDWLLGRGEEPRWSPALCRARETLWARAADDASLQELTRAQRIIAVWNNLRSLLPSFREDVWAMYLRWSLADWELCKNGGLAPGHAQIEGAEEITGIPQRWFRDGDRGCLLELQERAYKRAIRVMRAENLDPEDIVRIIRQSTNPRL